MSKSENQTTPLLCSLLYPLAFFLIANLLLRWSALSSIGYLNEDAALMLGARDSVTQHGILHWFTHTYGPKVIRPLQLISFWFDWKIFGFNPALQQFENLLLVSLGQALLFAALRRTISRHWLVVGLLPISLARTAAEANLWLSDRHDLFLLLFFAAALVLASRRLPTLVSGAGLLLIYSLCFLSNEKGLAVPLICLLYLPILDGRFDRTRLGLAAIAGLASYSLYLPYRAWILGGAVIGGYESKVLPDNLFTALPGWFYSTLTAVFRNGYPIIEAGFFVALLIAAALLLRRSSASVRFSFLLLTAAVLCSGLPTIRYTPEPFTGHIFSSRMLWLPLITGGILFSWLLERLAQTFDRRVASVVALASLALLGTGSNRTLWDFSVASAYTESLAKEFATLGLCLNRKQARVEGLPVHIRTINAFTEPKWLDYRGLLDGAPTCSDELAYLNAAPLSEPPRFIPLAAGDETPKSCTTQAEGLTARTQLIRLSEKSYTEIKLSSPLSNQTSLTLHKPKRSFTITAESLGQGTAFAVPGRIRPEDSVLELRAQPNSHCIPMTSIKP